MPNGREGNHPVSDIVTWGKAPFSPETNDLIRRIASFTNDFGVYDPFAEVEDLIWAAAEDQSKERELGPPPPAVAS